LGRCTIDDVSTKKAFEVAELVILEDQTDRIVGETNSEKSRYVDVVQIRHYTRFTLKVFPVHEDDMIRGSHSTMHRTIGLTD